MTSSWKQWEGEVVDNRYVLRRFLGGSDHSAVFLTEFGPPPKKAALKFLESNPATAQLQLSRWERAAKLSHPHLIRLFEGGRCQLGRAPMLYVVTELAEENLGQIVPNRPLTQAETEFMLRSVLEVLAYLHGQGLVHARLKPANVMAAGDTMRVSSDGICGVGDKRLGHGPPTVYDPPEIATLGYSRAGDVWSLGVTLVEVVTQHPSVGESIRQSDPPLPNMVPSPLLEIARQCLRLDPQRRWAVSDIAARLLPSASLRARKPAMSRYAGWGAAGAALLVTLFVGSKLLDRRAPKAPVPSAAKPTVLPERTPASVPPEPANATAVPKPPSSPQTSQKLLEKATDDAAAPAHGSPAPRSPTAMSGHDSAPGAVFERFVPQVSEKSRETITGKVRVTVRVSVDAAGKITDASLASPGPSRYFANLALRAAKRWRFSPPRTGGESVPSNWSLRFVFGRESTEVQPVQLTPAP